MTKKEIRRSYKKIRDELTDDLMNEYNKKIRESLFSLDKFKECTILFTYVSFGKEADTHAIITKALEMNKRVYVPKVEENVMNFYEIYNLDDLIRSNYGILEPEGDIRYRYLSSPSDKEKKLMLIPGLAFDTRGNRIGYGAGYYDRYLAGYPNNEWLKIALAYDFQILEEVAVGMYDIPADYILTHDKLIICKESS